MIDVENQPGENLFLMRTTLATASILMLSSAGDINKAQLFNPAGSQTLLTLTSAIFGIESQGGIVEWAFTAAGLLDTNGTALLRDTRTGVAEVPVGQIRDDQSVAGIAQHGAVRVLADDPYTLTDENGVCVLFPGTGITFAPRDAARQFLINFMWRERVFEPAEVNF